MENKINDVQSILWSSRSPTISLIRSSWHVKRRWMCSSRRIKNHSRIFFLPLIMKCMSSGCFCLSKKKRQHRNIYKYIERHLSIYVHWRKNEEFDRYRPAVKWEGENLRDNKIDDSVIIQHRRIFNHRQLYITTTVRVCHRHRWFMAKICQLFVFSVRIIVAAIERTAMLCLCVFWTISVLIILMSGVGEPRTYTGIY